MRLPVPFFFFLCFATALSSFGQDSLIAYTQYTRVGVQDEITIEYRFNADISKFTGPDLSEFKLVAGPYTAKSQNRQMINGEVEISTSFKYSYTVEAEEVGKHVVGSASAITPDGKIYHSAPLVIEVVEGSMADVNRPESSFDEYMASQSATVRKYPFILSIGPVYDVRPGSTVDWDTSTLSGMVKALTAPKQKNKAIFYLGNFNWQNFPKEAIQLDKGLEALFGGDIPRAYFGLSDTVGVRQRINSFPKNKQLIYYTRIFQAGNWGPFEEMGALQTRYRLYGDIEEAVFLSGPEVAQAGARRHIVTEFQFKEDSLRDAFIKDARKKGLKIRIKEADYRNVFSGYLVEVSEVAVPDSAHIRAAVERAFVLAERYGGTYVSLSVLKALDPVGGMDK